MNLTEHTSKELLAQYGVPIPAGRVARTAPEAEARCREIDAQKYVVKAQIAAGGRGLAGGIKFAATPSSVREAADALLGAQLVTAQTGTAGEKVEAVYIEAAMDLAQSWFIAVALDPATGQPMLLASTEGGVEFEERARMDPDAVQTCVLPGETLAECPDLSGFLGGLGLDDAVAGILLKARKAFIANDMTLLEINPFARTAAGAWLAIDAKVSIDGNAAFRHPEFEGLSAGQALTAAEQEAAESDINLVKLDGNIGVVVNGAGLGLATNDMLIDAGGAPANFMDIRTTATSFDIAKGVDLLLRDPKVKVILLNVHGGGMTVCDTVAEGVGFAYARSERKLPVVARLAGQNAEWGLRILRDRRIPVIEFETMREAVTKSVAVAKTGRI